MSDEHAYPLDKRRVARQFARAAATYDRAAILQREIADRLFERLGYIKLAPKRVVDLGCGTGYTTRKLEARYADATLVALDIALDMVRAARPASSLFKRWFAETCTLVLAADAEALPLADASMDLAFSNLMLQWTWPPRVFAECARVLTPGGLLMFTTFGPDTLKELRGAFASADRTMHVHRFIDMHDLGDDLVRAGFADPVMDMEVITLTYDTFRDVLRDLKAIGATNAALARSRGLAGKATFRAAEAAYERLRADGRLPATFEVVYGHAWKPLRGKPKPGDPRPITFVDQRKPLK